MGDLRRRDGFISGGGLSDTLLGYSDVGLMGFELNLAACCTVPLPADADTGYGNAANVYHTTQAFEQVGVAGLMIEDQTWPKRCGHMQGKGVIRAEERRLERGGLGAHPLRYIIPHLGLRCRLSSRQVRRAP